MKPLTLRVPANLDRHSNVGADYDRASVQRAIDDLPVHYRETLLLCEVEEMSYRQIAEILSVPIGTVMSRLARARKMVRESLGRRPGSPRRSCCR